MNTEELKRLAEPLAGPNGSDSNASWWDAFHRAANPAAILALIQQRDELLRIAGGAATSLETIHIRSFGDDSYLNHPDQMRAYAGSRAGVVRKELKGAGIDQ